METRGWERLVVPRSARGIVAARLLEAFTPWRDRGIERLLAGVSYDGYFLEYDTERAGGFEPLRFLPKSNKIVVLGLITSKSGTL